MLTLLKYNFLVVLIGAAFFPFSTTGLRHGDIYSFDVISNETVESLTVASTLPYKITFEEFQNYNPRQRFIARRNPDNTYNLFLESQQWSWIDHIVKKSKFVHINMIPRVLEGVGGLDKRVIATDYNASEGQKWYIVPSGNDPNIGMVTNVRLRLCITSHGLGGDVKLSTCSFHASNQQFTLTNRTNGRCF